MLIGKPASSGLSQRQVVLLVAVLVVVSGVVRVMAARGDLWLDEIWSLENLARFMAHATFFERFGVVLHDNTHPLNTLWAVVVGPRAEPIAYRALAIVSGMIAVAAAAAIGARRSVLEGAAAAAMVAFSYPMVHYASEARGYAPAVAAALVAAYLLDSGFERPSPGRIAAFVVVCLLGLASHLSFLAVLVGLGVWAVVEFWQRSRSVGFALSRTAALFGVQLAVVVAVAIVAWNRATIGGAATAVAAGDSYDRLMRLMFGLDIYGEGSATRGVGLVLAIASLGPIWHLYRRRDGFWIFLLMAVVVLPFGIVLADQVVPALGTTAAVWPRYFLVLAVFIAFPAARCLVLLTEHGRRGRIAATAAMALFLYGQFVLIDTFLGDQRGRYADALAHIASAAAGPVRVSGEPEFAVGIVVKHYAARMGLSDRIEFVVSGRGGARPAEWHIVNLFDGNPAPTAVLSRTGADSDAAYRLSAIYRKWGLSGADWAVYRLKN